MNHDEARQILQIYRPSATDANDPQFAEALALAKQDATLRNWFEEHCARQNLLREKFRQIATPAGLKEQILSEHAAETRRQIWPAKTLLAIATILVAMLAVFFWFHPTPGNTLASYQNQMASAALRGYNMDLMTDDATQIRAYLAQNHAPADYVLPAPLEKISEAGCAIQSWQNTKVTMICFRSGQPLLPGAQSDLWLFVVDRASVKNAPNDRSPRFQKINQLTTAMWAQGNKLYFLGVAGDEALLRKFL